MKVKEVNACSFQKWYNSFNNVTLKSKIIPIPKNVLDYLNDNGTVIIPDEENVDDLDALKAPDLSQFSKTVEEKIEDLGGTVIPKLNWSSPKDAVWVNYSNSMKCSFSSDVYMLLKSSDFISHDLSEPYKNCDDIENAGEINYCLVLRQWQEINPINEYRCFVKNHQLIGISVRYPRTYFEENETIEQIEAVIENIELFYNENIKENFFLESYVFDVYRPKNDSTSINLIDFNPFGRTTDSIMFSWDELLSENYEGRTDLPEYRGSICDAIEPSEYKHYGYPEDMNILENFTSGNPISNIINLVEEAMNKDSDSDE